MTDRRTQLQSLATRATRSDGVLTTRALHEIGFTDSSIHRLVLSGAIHRWRRGVFVVGHEAVPWHGRCRFALLAAGPEAALSHLSAARLWRITRRDVQTIHVTLPRARRPIEGVRQHGRVDLESREVAVVSGLRVTNVARTIASLGECVRAAELCGVMREAAHRGLLDEGALHEIARRERGRRGIATLREALRMRDGGSAGARSAAEQRVHDFVTRFPVERPAWNVVLSAFGRSWEVDFVFRDARIYLEVDGPTHGSVEARLRDEEQDALLGAEGWRCFRIDPREFDRDPIASCRPLLDALLACARGADA